MTEVCVRSRKGGNGCIRASERERDARREETIRRRALHKNEIERCALKMSTQSHGKKQRCMQLRRIASECVKKRRYRNICGASILITTKRVITFPFDCLLILREMKATHFWNRFLFVFLLFIVLEWVAGRSLVSASIH